MRIPIRLQLVAFAAVAAVGLLGAPPALALTEGPGWELVASTNPTNLLPSKTPGETSGTIAIDVFNVGAGASTGTITVTDVLPRGLTAKEAGALNYEPDENFGIASEIVPGVWDCTGNEGGPVAGATVVTCTNDPTGLPSFEGGGGTPTVGMNNQNNPQPVVGIVVEAEPGVSGTRAGVEGNHVSIAGGGALDEASTVDPITVSEKAAEGGLTYADAWFSNADGTIDRRAGSHPYTATFVFGAATALSSKDEGYLPGSEIRNLETRVPPGFIGDLRAVKQCTRQQLFSQECPAVSMVGRLKIEALPAGLQIEEQVFNMAPAPGVPAELGFNYGNVPVYVTFKVKTGGNYAITAEVDNIPQRDTYQSILTLWGTPGEESHDRWRYHEGGCSEEEMNTPQGSKQGPIDYCHEQGRPIATPFLRLPTSCGAPEPQAFAFRELNGWQEPNAKSEIALPLHDANDDPAGFTGCESLDFDPAITTSPDTGKSDTPAGLSVEVRPPLGGLDEPTGYSSADVENTVVALPPGLVINPGQAAGLQACGPTEDALTTETEKAKGEENDGPAACSNASKVGTVVIKSPLIEADPEKQFEGDVYVLQSNPPELKLLVTASADGVNLKLVGVASLCQTTGEVLDGKTCEAPGQVITAFNGTPQLPFTLFKLSFSGGAQAALDTPEQCETYTSNADFTPWSSPFIPDFGTNASFALTEGPDGTACPSSPMPFSPSLTAGATTDQAGGFTSFSMLLQRSDGQQRIEKLSVKAPAGLSGMISQVPLCDEADANAGTCPASSHIGHATVTSGPGPYPLVIPQPGEPEAPIYLTGPYKGAPFGLSIVTPVIAGPFNLGTIVTRASIAVDPHTAQITVTTDPLAQIVKGVPTDLREVDAVIDRPGFMFDPTNCTPQHFAGTVTSAGGAAIAPISSNFDVGACQALKFAPKFTASTSAKTSKANGASLHVMIAYPATAQGSEADISKVDLTIPAILPTRLTTIQKACSEALFDANPAGCPAASVIASAIVRTPVLKSPLMGPVYFVSHGGAAFPDTEIVLQGEGVKLVLDGQTQIIKGVTYSRFEAVPDAPFTSFEFNAPEGPYSIFGSNGNLCQTEVRMPTTLVAQNGAVLTQSTLVEPEGCANKLTIISHKINKRTLTLKVAVPGAGKLTATAKGLAKASKSAKGRGILTLTLNAKGHHKLNTKVELAFNPSKGTKLTAAVAARIKH